ncbi:hypothetical protein Tco_0757358, partial [Tanacetum coccineum]
MIQLTLLLTDDILNCCCHIPYPTNHNQLRTSSKPTSTSYHLMMTSDSATNRNIDREIALEKKIKQLDNIIFKRGQSAQTVHMMTKSKICYDHSSKQAIGFEKPFCLKKARESKPKLYDGNTILKMDTIVVPDSDETIELSEKSPYWKATSVPALDPSHSSTTVIVEVPKELPTVSMVNTSLKELKRYLTGFDQVVKERTTATAITEGTWGFEHTK